MVCALTEAWFTSGLHGQHPNPFSLEKADTQKWGLTKFQKYRALKFLAEISLVEMDRSDPKNPTVAIIWAPRQA
jgi:hypothetical protein